MRIFPKHTQDILEREEEKPVNIEMKEELFFSKGHAWSKIWYRIGKKWKLFVERGY